MNNNYVKSAKAIKIGNPTGKSILLLLADLSRGNQGFCWPSEDHIAGVLELSPSAVRKWLGVLVERKLIVKRRLTEDEGRRLGIPEAWKRSGYQMNFDPNQRALSFEAGYSASPPRGSGDTSLSAPPHGGDKPEQTHVSALPDSADNPSSAPQGSGDKDRQRHVVASSAPPRVSDTSWRHNSYKEEEFKPEEEPEAEEAPLPPRKPTRKQERVKTRPDLSEGDWLIHLAALNENRGIDVRELFDRMIAWCAKNREQPSRLRLLKWLEGERTDVPVIAPFSRNGHRPIGDPDRTPEPGDYSFETSAYRDPKPQRPPDESTPEEREMWRAVLEAIRKRVNLDVFNTWFKPVIFDGLNDDKNALKVRHRFITVDWIRRYYSGMLIEVLTEMGMGEFTFEWEIEEEEFEEVMAA